MQNTHQVIASFDHISQQNRIEKRRQKGTTGYNCIEQVVHGFRVVEKEQHVINCELEVCSEFAM